MKRWGKSPPRTGQPGRHGKPHREQCRIGVPRPARVPSGIRGGAGRLRPEEPGLAASGGRRRPSQRNGHPGGKPPDRIRLTGHPRRLAIGGVAGGLPLPLNRSHRPPRLRDERRGREGVGGELPAVRRRPRHHRRAGCPPLPRPVVPGRERPPPGPRPFVAETGPSDRFPGAPHPELDARLRPDDGAVLARRPAGAKRAIPPRSVQPVSPTAGRSGSLRGSSPQARRAVPSVRPWPHRG